MKNKKILILGVSGMLGFTLFDYFSKNKDYSVFGTVRNIAKKKLVEKYSNNNSSISVFNNFASDCNIKELYIKYKPDIVINCIGIIKQSSYISDAYECININSLFPHRLAKVNNKFKAKLILISTDCVFSGNNGMYSENDFADAADIYGKSKLLGEVSNNPYVLTIRTSIIGHELQGCNSLLNWFLNQKNKVNGFSNAYFSGFTTLELAKIFESTIFTNNNISGLFHISSDPINKYNLLMKISKVYNKKIIINKDDSLKINRSLNGELFKEKTGYKSKPWDSMIREMYDYNFKFMKA